MFLTIPALPPSLVQGHDMSHMQGSKKDKDQDAHKGQHFMNGHWMSMEDMMRKGMSQDVHKGALGDTSKSQEASGTSWVPGSSPHYMLMLPKSGRYSFDAMGQAQVGWTHAGGQRGPDGLFVDSMFMFDARRTFVGDQRLDLKLMTSLDAPFDGERGVPNLFQTGETAFGQPLVDRQHPHNLFSEVAASYSAPIGSGWRGFLYGGPVAEPALGDAMFMHRPSGMEIPEAPITHHWFDSTHISFGDATLGFTYKDRWKFEGSAFNGREPGENRYTIEPIRIDSSAGRVTFDPGKDWSFSASYGYLRSPEAAEPEVGLHRLTAAAMYNKPMGHGANLALAAMYGRNIKLGSHYDAYNLEATLSSDAGSIFARYENVEKDELANVPAGVYTINKLVFGAVKNYAHNEGFEYGIGAYIGVYKFPSSLEPYYGKNPFTFGVFWRIRPARMSM